MKQLETPGPVDRERPQMARSCPRSAQAEGRLPAALPTPRPVVGNAPNGSPVRTRHRPLRYRRGRWLSRVAYSVDTRRPASECASAALLL